MRIKIKRLENNIFKITDCEDMDLIGKRIIVDRIKEFNGSVKSGWYESDSAGNLWNLECNKLIGIYEIYDGCN